MHLQTTSPESKFPHEYTGVIFVQIDQHLKTLLPKYKWIPILSKHGVYEATGSTTCAITDTVGRIRKQSLCSMFVTWLFQSFWYNGSFTTTKKLRVYHLPSNSLSWIVSFVTDKSLCTKIIGIMSALESINRSRPIVQGSAIGPNSFSIYVADLKTLGVTNVVCIGQLFKKKYKTNWINKFL